jgi:hypothetical protein
MLLPSASAAHASRRIEGFHPGVQCDRSGVMPIVGTRFRHKGRNYDLCAREFHRLPDAEKRNYEAVQPTQFRAVPSEPDDKKIDFP